MVLLKLGQTNMIFKPLPFISRIQTRLLFFLFGLQLAIVNIAAILRFSFLLKLVRKCVIRLLINDVWLLFLDGCDIDVEVDVVDIFKSLIDGFNLRGHDGRSA